MTKAAALARVEAEKRVKEATYAKKRAREALERLAYLAAKENEMMEDIKGGGVDDAANKRGNSNGVYLGYPPSQITGQQQQQQGTLK
jgi:hypothetical protein